MTRSGRNAALAGSAAALGFLLAIAPATAQSVSDYRLPGATTTQAPSNTQGPVDPDNPVVRRPVAQPSAAPQPAPSATQPAATATTAPARTAAPPASQTAPAAPRPSASAPITAPAATSQAATSEAATPASTLPALPVEASSSPSDSLALPTLVPTPEPTTDAGGIAAYWPWIAGALALLVALFAALWWRGRSDHTPRITFEPPVVTAPEPDPEPAPPAAPAPPRIPEPQLSVAAPAAAGLAIALEARRMTASLVATTLSYTIRLTNHGAEPLATLAVEGDMISAHASLPPEQQIATGTHRLELRHASVDLAPGASIEFTGDFRLPLTSVTPIRAGEAAYFVPLARLRVEGSTASGGNLLMVQTFVVGEVPEDPAAALRPFRLDLGPRTFTRIGQRAVA